jgi:hypothetical protein
MTTDSINDEILQIKRELAARFGNDLDRIIADAKSRERNTITLPPRKIESESGIITKLPSKPVADGASLPTG